MKTLRALAIVATALAIVERVLFPVTMCYSLGPRGGHYRGAVHLWPWDSSCGGFPWTVGASMTWLQVVILGVLLFMLVRWTQPAKP